MCFSATASFATAGVTGVIGLVALSRSTERRQLMLAATPVFFAVQQTVEGLLWLELPLAPGGATSTGLTFVYLLFAQVFWPVYAPVAVLLIEPQARRRHLMLLCLAAGLGVGAYMLWGILARPFGAILLDDHIVYVTAHRHADAIAVLYFAATSLPLILSSQRAVVALGGVILLGSAVAYVVYWQAFVSVWCFFAAAASVVILCQFERSRRRLGPASA